MHPSNVKAKVYTTSLVRIMIEIGCERKAVSRSEHRGVFMQSAPPAERQLRSMPLIIFGYEQAADRKAVGIIAKVGTSKAEMRGSDVTGRVGISGFWKHTSGFR
jgi:hypothetical protein